MSVERSGGTTSKVMLLCTGVWKESMLDESGQREGAVALLGCHSSCLPSPGTVCVMRESESSHLSLATDTASWLAGGWVTHSRRGRGSPHKQDTQRCVEATTGNAKQLLHTRPQGLPVNHSPEPEFTVPDVWSSWIKD